jgi:hypothetical protein
MLNTAGKEVKSKMLKVRGRSQKSMIIVSSLFHFSLLTSYFSLVDSTYMGRGD